MAGFGKATQEKWGEMRDSSWVGIQEMYQKGEITRDQMNTFIAIRNLTNEEWLQIKEDYLKGNISKEEFEQIKQIREMPEDWTTLENGAKGLLYGAGTGVWEGLQWYLGGKLTGWSFKGSKVLTSAARVSVDTVFNAMDTLYRALLDSSVTGNTLEESWNSQGGWNSVLTNVGIGLIGSIGGEIFDNISKNDLMKIDDIDEFWKANRNGTKSYGVDQGICGKLRKTDKEYYFEIKNKIMNKYNMSAKDAAKFMDFIDSEGACTYAEAAGNIIDEFRKKPKEFEKKFGFPLYRTNSAGEVVTNEAELLADMYYITNHKKNGGELFETTNSGKNAFTGKSALEQKFMANFNMTEQKALNSYLKNKGIECRQKYICRILPYYDTGYIEDVKNKIKESLAKGDKLSMASIGTLNCPIHFMDKENNILLLTMKNGAHATQVTGICDDGIIVSTWGKKGLIKFEDFENANKCNFQVIIRTFKKKGV